MEIKHRKNCECCPLPLLLGTSRDGTTDGTIVTALHCTTVHKKFSHKIEFFYTIQPTYRVFIRLVRP